MAVAAERTATGTRRTWGVYFALTQDAADEGALEECRQNAKRDGLQAPCWLFAETASAPESIVAACRDGRASPERCAIQDKYGPPPR